METLMDEFIRLVGAKRMTSCHWKNLKTGKLKQNVLEL